MIHGKNHYIVPGVEKELRIVFAAYKSKIMNNMDMILPAITLYQPWATWIMRKWKIIETRTHDRFRSLNGKTILIHAGKTNDNYAISAFHHGYLTREQLLQNPDEMINGYILGSAFVCDFQKLTPQDSKNALIECFTERYGLFLRDIQKFETPLECKGEMGIWYYDIDREIKVKKAAVNTTTQQLF